MSYARDHVRGQHHKRMSSVQTPAQRSTFLASLKATTMLNANTKASLPAEIIAIILDYLPVPDLMRFARTSKRMQEMVYDDTRWVQKLNAIGCWNEGQARQKSEEATRRKIEASNGRVSRVVTTPRAPLGNPLNNGATPRKTSTTLFDAGLEEQRASTLSMRPKSHLSNGLKVNDGFTPAHMSPVPAPASPGGGGARDVQADLNVLNSVRSIRGYARQEYGRVYGTLAPLYFDLAATNSTVHSLLFTRYTDPEHQAKMLAQVRVFSKGDTSLGWPEREETLESLCNAFETIVLAEFEDGYRANDLDGRMRKYAYVLVTMNGGAAIIDRFINEHNLITDKWRIGNPMDCFENSFAGHVNLHPAHSFFERLTREMNEDVIPTIDRVFPPSADVTIPFLRRVCDDVISPYITPLFDESHAGGRESYLKYMSGVFQQSLEFAKGLRPPLYTSEHFRQRADELVNGCFDKHIDLYLREEMDEFKAKANSEVQTWEKKMTEQEESTESFFMGSINRSAEKRDFMTSFKKVLMAPVNALPTFSNSSSTTKHNPSASVSSLSAAQPQDQKDSRAASPERGISPRPADAPSNELAAKAALMNSKLKSMGSLFSLEVALNMVHAARASIERAAKFIQLGGVLGAEVKLQCQNIYIALLQTLGSRHIQPGFDKAIDHLSKYSARNINDHDQVAVQPLVTFLELVNVGDLIQQMLDVFFVQELVGNKLADRDDFLDPAVKGKKAFEKMLDERVASGLGKGIDVLMDEIDYICATTQLPADYNPLVLSDPMAAIAALGVGPSQTAERVVEIVASHTAMLTGAADKTMLDVFNQEVGLRLFSAICKHLKRQRVSTEGAIKLISDINAYYAFIQTLKNKELLTYYVALREMSQIFLVDSTHAKEIATIIADSDRYQGIFTVGEVLEYAERRADWYQIRANVEKAMYGMGCSLM